VSAAPRTRPPYTYHLVAAAYYLACDNKAPYVPADFANDGFIHCTDGADNLAATANRYYRDDLRMYVALVIDTSLVTSEIRYEDEAGIYPHIYGPLNRDAIVAVIPVLRDASGGFIAPEPRTQEERKRL
jgi:uncharacterized protein (DUF952 family)